MALDTAKAQEALVIKLTDAAICDGRVYDFLPESSSSQKGAVGQVYPFCVLDDLRIEEDDVGRAQRDLLYQVVQVWTKAGGKAEAQQISDAIKALLHRLTLAVSDGQSLRIVWENTQVFNDADGRAYRGAMRFRIHHEEDC
ncbi:DUF3168 domain-containing protein [Cohaesibacter celericrescens]|uniref:DUF3168 domain-containing protein n=1 Tax=Cohaesibacter celericrescens TaxID=2067669 RepID=A0A2N5XQQ7_9HYPH|nr:DUF3168 domain-containing protein [Cohaesibacter celericrescens]PLW76805.1 hypothetical protein C0081_12140 [Cohaesibacter celericrescens]